MENIIKEKYSLLGIEMSIEEFDRLLCEQSRGKRLKVVDGKVVAETYTPTTDEMLQILRNRREEECFPYINRGALWYETLTVDQRMEFSKWYNDWLNVTETLEVPTKPEWLS